MKKRIAAFILMLAAMLTLSGCGKFTCVLCGESKLGKKYSTEVLGQEISICSKCYKNIQAGVDDFSDGVEDLVDGLKGLFD